MAELATHTEDRDARRFRELTESLGLTTEEALRVFVLAFNRRQGFPFAVRINDAPTADWAPFDSEEEADEFVYRQADRMLDEAW
ncbi:hypothetical protein QJ043_03100 [Olsenella sp. YH-ols2217]|uniref:DNA-damage-inducible protein J n=1 Tax=Kribbibacterium absianum TaxID=3044210 RepID=A0ABT6ZKL1_9ACTN|nr:MULTISPECIES: hypothetical protein [unclassified Olsenella]MDJ1122635.1 hypothetical protein [Olsenella sp. YH-ols2216]MDJ1129073.1 hypothetical protein [Olsenella sp. YH-ols2217]